MGNLLYLVHRLPYPPNKGDKVRSYHLLKHLAARHNVLLGTFIDDPEDERHIDHVRSMCADLHVARISPRRARLRSLDGLVINEALTLRYYRNAGLHGWIERISRERRIDASIVFSSSMAQYVERWPRLKTLVDFVDVDSAKWTQYARSHKGLKSWIYRREGELLLAYERQLAARAARAFFVTEHEAGLFRQLAPECATRTEVMGNGVDSDYFSPQAARASPFPPGEVPVVFTGAMDYFPNEDAAAWLHGEIMPRVVSRWPFVRFYLVGRNPGNRVQALAGPHVVVTGSVPDVRPYLQHAAVVVAPLRIARGIQNKVLEAMSMARPVVASDVCGRALDAEPGRDLMLAEDAADFADRIGHLLEAPALATAIGVAARKRVLGRYSWEAHLSAIDRYLDFGNAAHGTRQ